MKAMYSPIVLDSIEPDGFPNVNLYVKQGNNYTLYVSDEMELSKGGLERLHQGGVEFVYIESANSDEVLLHIESNLKKIFTNDKLSKTSKNLVLAHVLMNAIGDVFSNPSKAETCRKCTALLQQHEFQTDDRREVLELLAKLAHYDTYLLKHSAQVTILSLFVHAKLFPLSRQEQTAVGVGAMLHDVGMLDVSYVIHEKNSALSAKEFQRVRHHPRHGHDMLFKMGLVDPLSLSMVLDHHERYNGTGYPRQLYEEEIPRSAQVASICDTFCALTTDRPYRPASPMDEAIRIMKEEKKLFNPEIFDAFVGLMTE